MDDENDGLDELRHMLRGEHVPTFPAAALDQALSEAVVKLGIGGYVAGQSILQHINPITEDDFARIAYASDMMPSMFEDREDARSAEKLMEILVSFDFDTKPHLKDLSRLFRDTFDAKSVLFE